MPDSPSQPPAPTRVRPARLAFAMLLLGNLCLAIGPWLVRLADVGPLASGFWRLALAAPLLLVATRIARQPIPRLPPARWLPLALAGLLFAADLAAWHAGILATKLANATLFGNIGSFLFAIYGFVVARTLPGRNQSAALLLAAAGVALLLGRSYRYAPEQLGGDLLCLLAGLFYTGYIILLERARTGRLAPLPVLAISTVAATGPMLAGALLAGDRIWPGDWTPLILLAIGSQLVGQGLLIYALGQLPPVVVGLGLLTQPVVAATIGWSVYGERLALADGLGAAAIAIALVLVRRPDRPRGGAGRAPSL